MKEEVFDKDNVLKNKTTWDRRLFLYGPSKGSRAIYCLEKIPRSRIRGVGSGSQVIGRGTISSFSSYYL